MTVGISSANLATNWLNMLKGTAFTAPALVALKLHIADPGATGVTSPAAGDTSRKTVTWGTVSGGSLAMTTMSGVWTNVSTTETITHISAWDSTTAGNFLYSGALAASQPWVNTNTLTITAHSFAFTPIAA